MLYGLFRRHEMTPFYRGDAEAVARRIVEERSSRFAVMVLSERGVWRAPTIREDGLLIARIEELEGRETEEPDTAA